MSRQIERLERYKKNKILILKQKKKLPNDTIRKLLRPFFRSCLWIQRKINGFSVEVLNKVKVPQDRSIIFAVTHIGKWDFEIVNEQIKEQFFVIVADFMHMYGTVSGFFMRLNGVIYVDEESREDKANTKSVMIKLLQSGKNVMIFPEGTWNLSENEIIRDIAYGTADAAISANAVIVPIAVEQYRRQFVICFGNMLDAIKLQTSKNNLTIILRDELASLKWKIWERKGICSRNTLSIDYWTQFILERCAEWWGYSMGEQVTNTFIPTNKREFWQIQRDLRTGKLPLWYLLLIDEESKSKV